MPDGVRDDDPALVASGSRPTIRKAGDGVEQRGTDKVTDLKPGVGFRHARRSAAQRGAGSIALPD